MEIQFSNLEKADLIIDCVYKGGTAKNISDEVLPKLLPKCGNSSGFRKVSRIDDPIKMHMLFCILLCQNLSGLII